MSSATDLRRLLEEEHRVLVSGKLSELEDIVARKELLLQALPATPPDELEGLARLADRNARLLVAAGRGVKAALYQVKDARSGGALRTYDRTGTATEHTGATGGVEKRF